MQNDKQKRFPLLKILIVQALVVAVLIALVFGIRKLSPKDYEAVELRYVDVMENESTAQPVKKAIGRLKALFVDEKGNPVEENIGGRDEDVNGNKYPDNCSASKYIISEDICVPANGRISSKFGYRINPVSNKMSFHTGIDIAADSGSPVKAAYYGMVEKAGEDDVYGKFITINHGNGIKTLYAHCSKLFVKAGEIVNAGDKIALVGSTGWSTGPHLHFSVIIDGIYCNPAFVIK